ncbi:hypothetical protein RRG08_022968 [Elysia crispata]|uniref:Uncharacterized protein n=1 Tax=Elysia crispata TaxID=231223 RepID=A0AAE1DX65_9GAST|nr:hypothetical protein RRG08_022968 [Elysia crispata]
MFGCADHEKYAENSWQEKKQNNALMELIQVFVPTVLVWVQITDKEKYVENSGQEKAKYCQGGNCDKNGEVKSQHWLIKSYGGCHSIRLVETPGGQGEPGDKNFSKNLGDRAVSGIPPPVCLAVVVDGVINLMKCFVALAWPGRSELTSIFYPLTLGYSSK